MYNLVHLAATAIINKLYSNKALANFFFNVYIKSYIYDDQMYIYYYVLITYKQKIHKMTLQQVS